MTEESRSRPVAVLGAGVMGVGIAVLAVGRGHPVVLVDVDAQTLTQAPARVSAQLRLATMLGAFESDVRPGNLSTTMDLDNIGPVAAVIESVTERADLKARTLSAVSRSVEPGTLIVSNTSAIPIAEMAEWVDRPEDFLGIHFMNPAYLITTVELIRGPRTGAAAIAAARSLLTGLGREAVIVGDGPGFVINRILQRMINEAARVVEEGLAGPEDVDALFTGCLGHRTGPLGTADIIGLDNVVDSLRVLHERTGDDGYRPRKLLLDKVKAGDFGQKTGRGFFDHAGAR